MFASLLPRRPVLAALVLSAVGPAVGVAAWRTAELRRLDAQTTTSDRLAGDEEQVLERIAAKEAVIAGLLAGRTTLAEAVAEFAALNRSRPEYMAVIRCGYPGQTDDEKLARNVIDYALIRVPDPAHRDQLGARLGAELQSYLGRQPVVQ